MPYEFLTQKEFLERYSNGERLFSNMLMQFFDISNLTFKDLVVKDSKILFSAFRNCEMINAVFNNCEIYWSSFYSGKIKGTLFDSSILELTVFEGVQFDNTRMHNCTLRMSAILWSNHASVDISTSMQQRFFTDISQVTQNDLEEAIKQTMTSIERLDIAARMKVKQWMREDMEHYGFKEPKTAMQDSYAGGTGKDAQLTYGEVRHLIESAFGAYSQKNQYQMKSRYEKQDEYRGKKRPDEIGF